MNVASHKTGCKSSQIFCFLFGRQSRFPFVVASWLQYFYKQFEGFRCQPRIANKNYRIHFSKLSLQSLPQHKQPNTIILLLTICLLIIPNIINAQQADTTQPINVEFITDQLENMAQSSDLNIDYSDLIDDYLYYAKNPINIF